MCGRQEKIFSKRKFFQKKYLDLELTLDVIFLENIQTKDEWLWTIPRRTIVQKNKSGMRAYSDMDLQWLTMIECLKDSGLQIKEIRQYIDWYREGDSTLQQRLKLLRLKKKVFESPDDFDKVTC